MYVVRRAFRNLGQMMAPGSVVEPAAIKRFKSRVAEGKIVEVTEHDFDKWQAYFKARMNVELTPIKSEDVETDEAETDATETDEAETAEVETDEAETAEVEAPKVVPVVKVVAK